MGNNGSKVNKILIFGNGTLSSTFLQEIHEDDYVIGVDRAAYWLIQNGRIPNVAIGDFDSVTPNELNIIQQAVKNVLRFPAEKNETDMELAVQFAVKQKPSEVLILGGIGSRMDHTLATMQLLNQLLAAKIPHGLVNETNRIQLIGKGRLDFKKNSYRYFSVLPYTNKITLSLSGFRYNLPKTMLTRGTTHGVSNEIVGKQGEITLFFGKAWIIESND
jgi:thiamine pyrophosphokinase